MHGVGCLFSAPWKCVRPRVLSLRANRALRERSPSVCRSDIASSRSVPRPPKGPDLGSVVEHAKVKHCEGPTRNPVASLSFPLRGTSPDTSAVVRHGGACLAGIAGIAGSLHEPHCVGQCRYSVRCSTGALGRSVSRSAPGVGSARTRTLVRRPSFPPQGGRLDSRTLDRTIGSGSDATRAQVSEGHPFATVGCSMSVTGRLGTVQPGAASSDRIRRLVDGSAARM